MRINEKYVRIILVLTWDPELVCKYVVRTLRWVRWSGWSGVPSGPLGVPGLHGKGTQARIRA